MNKSDSAELWQRLVGVALNAPGEPTIGGARYRFDGTVLRSVASASPEQAQTSSVFGFKWQQTETFRSAEARAFTRDWLIQRYGSPGMHPVLQPGAVVLDAGCGAGRAAIEYFGDLLSTMRYVGCDISLAVDEAVRDFNAAGYPGVFLQCDLTRLPILPGSVDVVFSEGVMHHTDSTPGAFESLARLVRPGGLFMFYVYRKKGPIREFTDDHIRAVLRALPPEEAWRQMRGLTKLGIALGRLGATLDVPEDVPMLGIKAGKIDVQRFFYWNVLKAFYRPEMTEDEMHHINFDWYAPANAHRHTEAEIREWCARGGFEIEREIVEDAGITVVARRGAAR
jgi:arsenite methyltransferase